MVDNTKVSKRPRGRPQIRPDDETRQMILQAARQEFHASGYAGASMNRVAERAGVSTKTMYRLIPTKAELFQSVISARISRFILEMDEEHLDGLPVDEALEHILIAYGTLTFDPDTVSSLRLVLAECDRFPEIAAAFDELALRRTTQTMEGWLRQQRDRGMIEIDDTATAVGMLRGMMVMEPQRAMMLGLKPPPDHAEIVKRARNCARLFLDGCRPKQR
ncbi:TetR/AcrR family transcriptional regulator [Aestuariivirga sp. YIM B02566]|uniref:TetR/AcrR family transcriptional regulator n=1 Tax=Taklimakanibacter albus TaxID=2800327 RepID=A0ACC5RES9_9HYPH|nr:TetR/AcrR family transcriptional regulator [Aestuariivirga sp. YIM B02566]MBK1871186.1 TetR/AcrR family transcriptional regulator [Aestuariivirga sp. YIM B02566]